MGDTREQVFDKSIENRLHLKRRFYRVQLKKGIFIGEYMNNYMKLLSDLANMKEMIKDEHKTLILLNSFSDEEYKTFFLTLINGKKSLSYNEVSTALVNHKLRKKDKESSISTHAKVLATREIDFNHRKDKRDISDTGNRKLRKNRCLSTKRKNTKNLIVQGTRIRRSQNQRLLSQWWMFMILTHPYFHFLLSLLFAIQKNLSGFWIWVLPISLVPKESGLLVLKN